MWKTKTVEPPLTRSVMSLGKFDLSVEECVGGGKNWQYFMLSFGAHSDDDHADCLKTWPREALRLARQKLDEFESELRKTETP